MKLIDQSSSDTALTNQIVLEVVNQDGTPNQLLAHAMRTCIDRHGMLSAPPTEEQAAFLTDLRLKRFNSPGGFPVS